MKKSTDNRTMSFRRLLSLLLGLVLFMELLPGGLTVVGDASDAVTVTVDGARATQVTLPQSGRVMLEAASETGDTDYQWQIQLDGQWVNIYDATAEALTLTFAMVSPALENGSAMVRCAVGEESVSDDVKVTVSYDVEADSADLNRQKEALAQETAASQSQPRRASRRTARAASEYIEVSVNYLDAVSRLPIYTGFSATIKSGEPYRQTVLSPTYLGYAPFNNPDDPDTNDPDTATVSAQSLTLSIDTDYTGDTYTVNVYYKAIQVPYAVRYYFQDIHDDMYTEDVGYYKQGSALTGTIVSNDDLALDADQTVGFTKLYHYPEAVAADGSTVFECYYDRNYYMLTLDADGGYGSEHVYARYGTPFVPITPTRHGYVFAGWDKLDENGQGDGEADVLPGTIPAENSSYKALWKSADTTYTVVYWLKKPESNDKADSECTPNDLTYITSVTVDATAGDIVNPRDGGEGIDAPKLEESTYVCGSRAHEEDTSQHTDDCELGSTLRHYVYDSTDMAVEVKGDGSTVVNTVYKRREYTLRFYYGRERNDNGTIRYEVVGGSTYNFGNKDEKNHPCPDASEYSDMTLLKKVNVDWGAVEIADGEDMSSLISQEYKKNYTLGTLPEDGSYNDQSQKYYYLEFTAPYGADITDLWPSEVFGKVPLTDEEKAKHTNGGNENLDNGGWGNYAYFAGWNGEFNVKYTQDNSNSTIKCYYPLLDDTLLYDESRIPTYGDPSKVSFLGFFDNGANVSWSVPIDWTYELYLPILNDSDEYDLEWNGVKYSLYKKLEVNDDSSNPEQQTSPPLTGFSILKKVKGDEGTTSDGRKSITVQHFYTRNTYTLSFQNHSQRYHTNVHYAAPLDSYVAKETGEVEYPDTLEPGAYTFDGWYSTSGHYKGTEYVTGSTMPAHNVALYAGWSPVQYTVKMFRTRADMEDYQTNGNDENDELVYYQQVVDHGSVVGEVPTPADTWSGHSYSFNGWFYLKNGKKTAFTPTDTAVKQELLVYADWGSHTAQPYLIHYVLEEKESDGTWTELLNKAALYSPADGKAYTVSDGSESRTYIYSAGDSGYHRQIAADTRGYANQGTTRTFYPKAGDPYNQLDNGFSKGYYPTLASHSITMEEEPNVAAPTVNVFTFYYVYAAEVSYTVEYRYHDTGELIGSTTADGTGKAEKSTSKAVVTERFAVVQDYVPDAFYKRLILAVVKGEDGKYVGSKDNLITFYYTRNTQNAYYAIHYMLQNVDAATDEPQRLEDGTYSNYTESNVHTEGIGEIGATLSVTPQKFSGFTMQQTAVVRWNGSSAETTLNGDSFSFTVHVEGTDLYVFYARNLQTYTTYYLRYGADINNLTADDELLARKTLTGKYGAVVTETAESIDGYHCVSAVSQSIVLRPNDAQNYIIFYYEPLQYTVEYRVWTYGGGALDNTIEVVEGTNEFKGSTPTAKSGYTFVGWYLDAECTIPVGDKGTVDEATGKLTPERGQLTPAPQTNVFYARFKAVYGNVTIERTATADESNGDQTYIYRLISQDDPTYIVEVTVPAGGSTTVHDLPCGSYTVEQVNSWSWRYSDSTKTVEIEENQTESVTFDKSAVKDKWLTGNSAAVVNRRER